MQLLDQTRIAALPTSHQLRLLEGHEGLREPNVKMQPSLKHLRHVPRRSFHDYFVTHLPSSSMHPESRSAPRRGPHHKLPREQSSPHIQSGQIAPVASVGASSHTTVVRIPLKSAKHHFGAACVRGTRPYNEDAYQAGTIELPAFAKKPPASRQLNPRGSSSKTEQDHEDVGPDLSKPGQGAGGDPQVFYFGVFDGHGGDKCSHFLRDQLHSYVENSAKTFSLQSSLKTGDNGTKRRRLDCGEEGADEGSEEATQEPAPEPAAASPSADIGELERSLVSSWKETVGGYFRRFKPDYFLKDSGGKGIALLASIIRNWRVEIEAGSPSDAEAPSSATTIEQVLSYAFLRADLDFITDKLPGASSSGEAVDDDEDEEEEELGRHGHHGSTQAFLGGSTCTIALISTPTPTPFWHPTGPFSILASHVGDTRLILCSTASGAAIPLTSTHHPSMPVEQNRLRRFAGAFSTDSFGEERLAGLANTRAFGDRRSKRMGVSAEPELVLYHANPAEFSFLVMLSDGVTGALSDQEVVDVVKEANTPEKAARDVVSLATEIMSGENGDADNATAMVLRLGGWERRNEGGGGSLGTKEQREWRRAEASDPRRGRT